MSEIQPEIQLISNLVVTNEQGEVLFLKHDPDEDRWWLPGDDLRPYQHPDERAREVLAGIEGLVWKDMQMVQVESFRGRRGWHVMFDYRISAAGDLTGHPSASWFAPDQFPKTKHGQWELDTIRKVLEFGADPVASN